MENKIKAKIVSIEKGLQQFDGIEMIRVVSDEHNLLILQNYMPLLGRLNGYVDLIFQDKTLRFSDLQGYYMHKKNEFSLLVQTGDTTPSFALEEE